MKSEESKTNDLKTINSTKRSNSNINKLNQSIHEDKLLFQTEDLDLRSSNYDIFSSNSTENDILLSLHNPSLNAFKNKSKKLIKNSLISSNAPIKKPNIQQNNLLIKKNTNDVKRELGSINLLKKQIDLEKRTISFLEDPIAYFSKRKDGRVIDLYI